MQQGGSGEAAAAAAVEEELEELTAAVESSSEPQQQEGQQEQQQQQQEAEQQQETEQQQQMVTSALPQQVGSMLYPGVQGAPVANKHHVYFLCFFLCFFLPCVFLSLTFCNMHFIENWCKQAAFLAAAKAPVWVNAHSCMRTAWQTVCWL
jgi:cation transport ATPase